MARFKKIGGFYIFHKYKNSLIAFIESFPWHLFGTIGIGHCSPDEETIRRLRLIEAILNNTFVCKNYHHLPPWERFQIIVAFEGETARGDRHCHFLVYVPIPRKTVLSRDTLIDKLPLWVKILWNDLSDKPWSKSPNRYPAWFWNKLPFFYKKRHKNGFEWHEKEGEIPLDIGRCREAGPSYSLKYVSEKEVDWSEWHFITPPKFTKFENQNLIVCSIRNRQVRRSLGLS